MSLAQYLVYFFLFLFLISFAYAQPPLNDVVGGELSLTRPTAFYYKQNVDFNFSIHVFNSTNYPVPGFEGDCELDVYDSENNKIIDTVMSEHNIDFFHVIPGSNLSVQGIYPFVVHCNTTYFEGGFYAGDFEITGDGLEKTTNGYILGIFMLLPLIFSFLIYLMSNNLPEEYGHMSIIIFLFGFLSFILSLMFGIIAIDRFYIFPQLSSALGWFITIVSWLFVFFFAYIMFFFAWLFLVRSTLKRNERRYG